MSDYTPSHVGRSPARRIVLVCAALLAVWMSTPTSMRGAGAYTSYADVRGILAALDEILPPELKAGPSPEAAWAAWTAHHDREIRERLERGDEDTLVNWLLLGTTFTTQPRLVVTATSLEVAVPAIAGRARDLAAALAAPGGEERRLFARTLLEARGFRFDTAADRARVVDHLAAEVRRVIGEQAAHARDLAAARQLGNTSQEFAARSRLFRTRGLSLDTSFLPNFALERSLGELLRRGLLPRGSVRQVAVIGPGLDFSDKSSGYDFYPQQTLQPFAIVDSLVRVGLAADPASLTVTTLDLSPRVNDHLAAMRRRAAAEQPYVVQLPLDASVSWTPEVAAYWKTAGDRVGRPIAAATAPPAGPGIDVRAVAIAPAIAQRIEPEDLNIVVQRLDGRQFDLVVATNVFIYYDILDQVLALANVEAMLRPGGFLLSNQALLELPSSGLRSVGYVTVQYSDRPDDGDHVVWYQAK